MGRVTHFPGEKIGKLTLLKRNGSDGSGSPIWECVCDCGNTIKKTNDYLNHSKIPSCGCWAKKKLAQRSSKLIKWTQIDDNTMMGITNNLGGIEFTIDIIDFDKCKDICWSAQKSHSSDTYYIHGKTKYNGNCEYIHRYIFNLSSEDKNVVDHINHDGTDNRRSNLRIVTHSQNAMNMANYKNPNKQHGVNWNDEIKKWVVEIWANKQRFLLGTYNSYTQAVSIRKEAEEKYFGEYSYDKSIQGGECIEI